MRIANCMVELDRVEIGVEMPEGRFGMLKEVLDVKKKAVAYSTLSEPAIGAHEIKTPPGTVSAKSDGG
jgi:hypothetical protein